MKKMNVKIRISMLLLVFLVAVSLHAKERSYPFFTGGSYDRNFDIEGRVRHMGLVILELESVDECFNNKGFSDNEMRDIQRAYHMRLNGELNTLSDLLEEDAESPSPRYTVLREAVSSILEADAGFDAENGYAGLDEDQKDRQYWEERVAFDVEILKQQFGPPTNGVLEAAAASEVADVLQPADDIAAATNTVPRPKEKLAISRAATTNAEPVLATEPPAAAHPPRLAFFLMVLGVGGLAALGLRIALRKR